MEYVDQEEYTTCAISSCTKCRRYEQVNKQIIDAKALLASLVQERQELKAELNHTHKSLIDRVPVEVAAMIFGIYASELWHDRRAYGSALILGAVCRNWRRIAWSTPSVWQYLTLFFSETITSNMIQIGKAWLERSGRLPLTIELLNPRELDIEEQLPLVLPLIHAINDCSDRWRSLTFQLPSSYLSHFRDAAGASRTMSYLEIWASPSCPLNMRSTSPQRVENLGVAFDDMFLDWSNIYAFSTGGWSVHDCIETLRRGPQLDRCSFTDVLTNALSTPLTMCRHPHLSYLFLSFDSVDDSVALFFDNITLPALVDLTICFPALMASLAVPVSNLAAFFRRSACALKTLRLLRGLTSGEDFVHLAMLLPSLSFLSLQFLGPIPDDIALRPFYRSFSSQPPIPESGPDNRFLPCLEKFELSGRFTFPNELIHSLFNRLSSQDVTDHCLRKVAIECECGTNPNPAHYVSRLALDQLLALRSLGFDFQVKAYLNGNLSDLVEVARKVLIGDVDVQTSS